MSPAEPQVSQIVGHLFRTEYGKMVAVLTSAFGLGKLQVAEDLVQETLVAAMHHFSLNGVPDNPAAWLMQVAKNKALNHLKSTGVRRRVHDRLEKSATEEQGLLEMGASAPPLPEAFLKTDIEDSQLRMIFACCHPNISQENQLALVLKTLCGLGSREVASALLLPEETINKRLYRARQQLAAEGVTLEVPGGPQLAARLDVVCKCVYLLFNEGYNSTEAEEAIRRDFCVEAMRLCDLLCRRFEDETQVSAMMALMCLHSARFDSRIDAQGALVPFQEQDRSLWDQRLIQRGLFYMTEASHGTKLTTYHLEASIAAQHCIAPSFQETDWGFILQLYQQLLELTQSPLVRLNVAIARSFAKNERDALGVAIAELEQLKEDKHLRRYGLLFATLAEFYRQRGELGSAVEHLKLALQYTTSAHSKVFLQRRLGELCNAESK